MGYPTRVACVAVDHTAETPRTRCLALPRLATASLAIAVSIVLPVSAAGAATAPPKWAKAVCGATSAWVAQVAKAADLATATVPESSASVKKTLGRLLTTTVKSTATARKKLAQAGTPAVPNGKQIAATVKEGFRQVDSSLKQAKKGLANAAATDPVGFNTTVRGIQDGLESGLESIQAAFSAARDADDQALLKAFARTSSCTAITG